MSKSPLRFFTDPTFLRRLDRPLLRALLGRFTHLLTSNHGLPNIDALDFPEYYQCLTERLGSPAGLPDQLLQALHEIEALAVPEDYPDITRPPLNRTKSHHKRRWSLITAWSRGPVIPSSTAFRCFSADPIDGVSSAVMMAHAALPS
jgi:hypothetical protein